MTTTTKRTSKKGAANGLEYAPGIIGKHLFRVRERYLADTMAPLLERHRVGAAKLDLVLRGIALLPEHAGDRPPGTVIRARGQISYEALHDLVRDHRRYSTVVPEDEDTRADITDRKRKWVGEQLQVLEELHLVRRTERADGRRPELLVLSDLGDNEPFDDPGEKATISGNSYVTILGSVIASEAFPGWGAPELAAYVCCMVADRYEANRRKTGGGPDPSPGSQEWYRQAEWFNNENGYRPSGHVVLPFATKTIRRGLQGLAATPMLDCRRSVTDPSGRRLQRARNIYRNRFHEVGAGAEIVDLQSYLSKTG